MTSLLLKPAARQLYQIQPEHSHPKLSLIRVLWVKFLRWIDKATPAALTKASMRLSSVLLIGFAIFAPQFLLGMATSILHWNSYRIPIFLGSLAALLNAKRMIRLLKRRRATGNQHTYHGIPIGEFAAWLMEAGAFKRDDAMSKWAFSQGQYAKVAAELEQHGILTRGENNARMLRDITMENLVRQLRDGFPLVWSEERQVWAERNGAFERWALSQDFKRRKLEEMTARKERKLERIEKKIATMADVFAYSPQTAQ